MIAETPEIEREVRYRRGNIHKNARTTIDIRKKIKNSKKSNVYLAKKYNIHRLTVAKWKKRESPLDQHTKAMAEKPPNHFEPLEEAIIFFIRKATGLTLDRMMDVLTQTMMPDLKRDKLYKCLMKYRLNKRQTIEGQNIFAQILPIKTKDRAVSFLMAFQKNKWKGFIHIVGSLTKDLESFTMKRPFQVLELDNPSVLNYYQKKNNLEAFSSSFSLFQFESRLRKTLKYIEHLKENEDDDPKVSRS